MLGREGAGANDLVCKLHDLSIVAPFGVFVRDSARAGRRHGEGRLIAGARQMGDLEQAGKPSHLVLGLEKRWM